MAAGIIGLLKRLEEPQSIQRTQLRILQACVFNSNIRLQNADFV